MTVEDEPETRLDDAPEGPEGLTQHVPVDPEEVKELAWSIMTELDQFPEEPVYRSLFRGTALVYWALLGVGLASLTAAVMLFPHPAEQRATAEVNPTPYASSISGIAPTKILTPDFSIPGVTANHMVEPEAIPPAPTPPANPDQVYLRLLRDDGFNVYNPARTIDIGHQACDNLAQTHNLYETGQWVHEVLGIKEPQASSYAVAASVAFCPNTPS